MGPGASAPSLDGNRHGIEFKPNLTHWVADVLPPSQFFRATSCSQEEQTKINCFMHKRRTEEMTDSIVSYAEIMI